MLDQVYPVLVETDFKDTRPRYKHIFNVVQSQELKAQVYLTIGIKLGLQMRYLKMYLNHSIFCYNVEIIGVNIG